MTGPRTDVGEAKLLEQLSDITWMTVNPDLSAMTRVEIDPTPAHDPVLLTIRTTRPSAPTEPV